MGTYVKFRGYKGNKKKTLLNFGYLGCLQVFENHNPGYVLFFLRLYPIIFRYFLVLATCMEPCQPILRFQWDFWMTCMGGLKANKNLPSWVLVRAPICCLVTLVLGYLLFFCQGWRRLPSSRGDCESTITRWWQLKYVLFSPLLGERMQFDVCIFFRWVETTN